MDKSAIKFEIIRKEGKVSGFSLMGVGQTEAECFCYSFPSALSKGKAGVVIEGKKIVFKHSGYYPKDVTNVYLVSEPGEYAADISEEDAIAIRQLLDGEGPYEKCKLHCKPLNAWGHGFELRAE